MKSLKEYAMNITEQDYHRYPAWSYSKIARYARGGFQALSTLDQPIEQTPEIRFGSLVDTMITRGKSEFMNRYVVSDEPLPTPAKKAVIDNILARTSVPFSEIPDSIYKAAFDECDYQKNYSFEKKIQSLQSCYEYYTLKTSGKEVISSADYADARAMMMAIRNDNYLKDIFGVKNTDGKEYLYQLQLLSNIEVNDKTYPVKCMFDLLIVDHKNKTLQGVDLKTSHMPGYDFWTDHFVKMRYDIEAQVYTAVLQETIKNTDYKSYTILPYLFTDICRTDKVPVTYSYNVTENPEFKFKNYTYKNWRSLLAEIDGYQENHAVVPSYIRTDGPNDILELLNNH